MSNIKHELVTATYYSVVLNTSNRMMPEKLNDFFSGFDLNDLGDDWYDYHSQLCDYEGDFEGIEIYHTESLEALFFYISEKLGVDRGIIGKNKIKITCI